MRKTFEFSWLVLVAVAAFFAAYASTDVRRSDDPAWQARLVAPVPVHVEHGGTDALPFHGPRRRTPLVGSASLPPTDEPEFEPVDPTLVYRQEIALLRKRIAWLETELDLCGSEVTRGPIGRWLATLRPDERPQPSTLRLVAEYLRPYPIELTTAEGLWVAAAIEADDWGGLTTDEAIIRYLGPARLLRELPPHIGAELRSDWAGEGVFRE